MTRRLTIGGIAENDTLRVNPETERAGGSVAKVGRLRMLQAMLLSPTAVPSLPGIQKRTFTELLSLKFRLIFETLESPYAVRSGFRACEYGWVRLREWDEAVFLRVGEGRFLSVRF